MKRAALLSVSDKSGIVELARVLSEQGFTLLSTSGTLKHLRDAGLEVISIADYTQQREILDGRVKTLHPLIHAGLLARRDDSAHMAELLESGILPIDVAVINLYPFKEQLAQRGNSASLVEMVEFIDIGGPTMLRAAAKNLSGVVAVVDPQDYQLVAEQLKSKGELEFDQRLRLSEKVFRVLADYNLQIAKYLSMKSGSKATAGVVLEKAQELRYGENPHQAATLYREVGSVAPWRQLAGKELSYNNLLDLDAALRVIKSFSVGTGSTVALLKHLNPCGLAQAEDPCQALSMAQKCDPRSHFGGVVAVNTVVTAPLANQLAEVFYEIIVAPSFSSEALQILGTKKALRLIAYDDVSDSMEMRSVEGGVLIQEQDLAAVKLARDNLVVGEELSEWELQQLRFAWLACRHVKSNAIVLVKDFQMIGVGAGQMSRVDSVELALARATRHGFDLQGAVAASDAFFPFPDAVELLAEAGIAAVVAPAGAKRDAEVQAVARAKGVKFVVAETRHFRH